ncbi:hypothetical protein WJX84_009158 [Apatococcus fuscideae]|uniref:Uncharacterized protein n=1 Tax=Apatococcus fuscideae TaxID=2026836 RepID=A0AAW1TES5_9CHLO
MRGQSPWHVRHGIVRTLWGASRVQQLQVLDRYCKGRGAQPRLCLPWVTRTNYELMANLIGSEERLIILTTLDLNYHGEDRSDPQLAHMRNFAYHLNSIGRLRNTLIVSYTKATAPLQYRLLPVETFSNFLPRELRVQEGLPINQVVLHAGEVQDQGKVDGFMSKGLWKADEWALQMGAPLLEQWASKAQQSTS